jgi:hypothetical protein
LLEKLYLAEFNSHHYLKVLAKMFKLFYKIWAILPLYILVFSCYIEASNFWLYINFCFESVYLTEYFSNIKIKKVNLGASLFCFIQFWWIRIPIYFTQIFSLFLIDVFILSIIFIFWSRLFLVRKLDVSLFWQS